MLFPDPSKRLQKFPITGLLELIGKTLKMVIVRRTKSADKVYCEFMFTDTDDSFVSGVINLGLCDHLHFSYSICQSDMRRKRTSTRCSYQV